ncbi:MAG: dihydropteroate synthase [Acidimicrobiia bacterium]|nr:dihydropteroate synthase [Acidimicrobiia bacterium]
MTEWRLRTRTLDLEEPRVMGIVNTTPDSFSDGGVYDAPDLAIRHGRRLVAEGADIIDVGGESTRPGASPVAVGEEIGRTLPVISDLAAEGIVVSIDTRKPEVALAALEAGAEIVNDVSGARQDEIRSLVKEKGAGLVVMHMRGDPATMQDNPTYGNVVREVTDYLAERAATCVSAGIPKESIVIDPGFGFGKNVSHNLALLGGLEMVVGLGYPVLVGTSRKSFLGRVAEVDDVSTRDSLTAVTSALAIERGVSMVRVHDVATSVAAIKFVMAMVRAVRQQEETS